MFVRPVSVCSPNMSDAKSLSVSRAVSPSSTLLAHFQWVRHSCTCTIDCLLSLIEAHDALHHFSCKMLTPRHCTGSCSFKSPLSHRISQPRCLPCIWGHDVTQQNSTSFRGFWLQNQTLYILFSFLCWSSLHQHDLYKQTEVESFLRPRVKLTFSSLSHTVAVKLKFSLSLLVCCLHYSKGHLISLRRLALASSTVCPTQWCSPLFHINSGIYFSSSLSIYWCMSSIDPSIDLPCNPLPICLFQRAFKWFVRLSY